MIEPEWSPTELEKVEQCPACGESDTEVLHSSIRDRIFGAPGQWTLYQCVNCKSAYPNPRPSLDAIGKAYTTYYTHADDASDPAPKSAQERLKRALAHGYINKKYNVRFKEAAPLGYWLLPRLFPVQKSFADRQMRLLRLPETGGRLLDVGCGSGGFLLQMNSLGWDVVGLDFDTKAVDACQRGGVTAILGTLENANLPEGSFDAITLSHVIEHLHKPLDTLAECVRLLKPGGALYLETPNILSSGHAQFKEHWRGLEQPRHLTIFNAQSLQHVCLQVGLSVECLQAIPATFFLKQSSMAIRDGRDPYGPDGWLPISKETAAEWKKEEKENLRRPERSDIISVLARKTAVKA